MGANALEVGTTVVPALRYRNVPAAIDWLCRAFGFEKDFVVRAENGAVRYVQLTFGSGMIMVGPAPEVASETYMRQPDEVGGVETQTCYFFIEDVKAHYARAKAAGAEIVLDIDERGNSGLGYSCRDPEGHIWNFGTYNPWRRSKRANQRKVRPAQRTSGWRVMRTALIAGPMAAACVLAAIVLVPSPIQERLTAFAVIAIEGIAPEEAPQPIREPLLPPEGASNEAAQHAALEAREQWVQERSAREAAEAANREARELLTQMRRAVEQATRSAREAREQLGQALDAKRATDPSVEDARARLVEALAAKEAAERVANEAREELAETRSAKEAAERTAREARERAARERAARAAAERAAAAAKAGSGVGPLGF